MAHDRPVPLDFHDPRNAVASVDRRADEAWGRAIRAVVDPRGCAVVDLGCGGGTYARAWLEEGAASVVAVDSSRPILATAAATLAAEPRARLVHADAVATTLASGSADIVFARALVHHLADLAPFARECARLLKPGGTLIVQDRTMSDVAVPGSPRHPRGYFFAVHPQLFATEVQRRFAHDEVADALGAAGFGAVHTTRLWETRQRYGHRDEYLAELRTRAGRSILHELDDDQLADLVAALGGLLADGPLAESDRWTLWSATKPVG